MKTNPETIPTTMRAVAIREPGDPSVLVPVEVPTPRPGRGEVLIRVAAAGINRPDVVQRQGRYPVPSDASPLPGLEVSGVVAACGPEAGHWKPGDRVMALTHGGGYAGYVAVDEGHCLPWPGILTAQEAACLPEVGFTVEFNMIMRAGLRRGETVLIHGGASGIGAHAIQRAKALGARVVATAGSPDKLDFARALGADLAVDYRGDWEGDIRTALGGDLVDVVLDMVAGGYVGRNLGLMARNGRYALIALLGGPNADVPMNMILRKALTLVGSTLRPQPAAVKTEIARAVEAGMLPSVEAGRIRPHVFRSYPLECAAEAHALMESGGHMGKIALTITDAV